jgi:hypothetical protein
MAERLEIAPLELDLSVYSTRKESWFLLTAGDYGSSQFNSMSVAWGGMGAMWDSRGDRGDMGHTRVQGSR